MTSRALCAIGALASAAAFAPESWMADNTAGLGGLQLRGMTLPGTHDSGAYELFPAICDAGEALDELITAAEKLGIPVDELITPWGEAQSVDFYEQMQGGIRYFDLRSGWNGTDWVTFHMECGLPVQDLVADIAKFLGEQPGEIVVVEASHLVGSPSEADQEALADLLEGALGAWMLPEEGGMDVTYEEMVAADQRAVVTLDSSVAASRPLLWAASTIHNTYADSDDLDTMVAYNYERVAEFHDGDWSDQLYKMSWTLTPAADAIVEGVLFPRRHPTSLQELADTAAPALDEFVANITAAPGWAVTGNILIIDHFQSSSVVELCLAQSLSA